MRQFNPYWQTHVPGIKPTLGYPSDAGRFMKLIREKMAGRWGLRKRRSGGGNRGRLGLTEICTDFSSLIHFLKTKLWSHRMCTRSMIAILCLAWFVIPLYAVPVPDDPKPRPGDVVEVEIAKGVKMEFCWIPPERRSSDRRRGRTREEKDYTGNSDWSDETELKHEFTTKGFWLGKYPVTQEQWEAVMGNNPSWFSKQGAGKSARNGHFAISGGDGIVGRLPGLS